MKNIKKTILSLLILCSISIIIIIFNWLVWYYKGLKPELLFEQHLNLCNEINFDSNGFNIDDEIYIICNSQGFPYNPRPNHLYFALKGHKVKRLIPDRFHSVKVKIEFSPANPDVVYFYRYRKRYEPYMFGG